MITGLKMGKGQKVWKQRCCMVTFANVYLRMKIPSLFSKREMGLLLEAYMEIPGESGVWGCAFKKHKIPYPFGTQKI